MHTRGITLPSISNGKIKKIIATFIKFNTARDNHANQPLQDYLSKIETKTEASELEATELFELCKIILSIDPNLNNDLLMLPPKPSVELVRMKSLLARPHNYIIFFTIANMLHNKQLFTFDNFLLLYRSQVALMHLQNLLHLLMEGQHCYLNNEIFSLIMDHAKRSDPSFIDHLTEFTRSYLIDKKLTEKILMDELHKHHPPHTPEPESVPNHPTSSSSSWVLSNLKTLGRLTGIISTSNQTKAVSTSSSRTASTSTSPSTSVPTPLPKTNHDHALRAGFTEQDIPKRLCCTLTGRLMDKPRLHKNGEWCDESAIPASDLTAKPEYPTYKEKELKEFMTELTKGFQHARLWEDARIAKLIQLAEDLPDDRYPDGYEDPVTFEEPIPAWLANDGLLYLASSIEAVRNRNKGSPVLETTTFFAIAICNEHERDLRQFDQYRPANTTCAKTAKP